MKSLLVAVLFVAANMVATLGVFVPSVSASDGGPAAPVLVSPANGALVNYGDIERGAFVLQFTTEEGVEINLVRIAGKFLQGDTELSGQHLDWAPGLSLSLADLTPSGPLPYDYYIIVGETYTWQVRSSFEDNGSTNPDDLDWGAWSEERQFTVTSEDVVAPPTAPTLTGPADDTPISRDDIYDNDNPAKLTFTSADDVQNNHIQVTGVFDRGDGVEESKSINKVSEDESFALENFVPQDNGYTYIVGNTYIWRVRSSFNEVVDVESNAGWGVWSTTRQFTVTAGSAVPAAPTLVSPENNGEVVYDTIYELDDNKIARFVYKPALGVKNNNIILTGDFGSGVETIDGESITGNIELEEFVDDYDFIVGNTYKWQVRSNFVEDVFSHTEEDWGDWSEERSFTVVLAPTAPETGGSGQTGGDNNPGETPKTTSTPTGNGVQLASTAQGGEVLAQQDSTGTLSDSTGEDLDDEEQAEEGADEDESEDEPFLLLGWWWLPLLIAAGGGAYYFFKTPSEE